MRVLHELCCAEAIGDDDNSYVLKPHVPGFENWSGCAFATATQPCSARTEKGRHCPKDAVVLLECEESPPAGLCGGHFGVHRRGEHELRVYL